MKNMTILFIIGIIVVAGAVFLYTNSSGSVDSTGGGNNGQVQKIALGYKNYNYYPNTIKVNAGQPVSITLDSSIGGCFRSFTIRDLGVYKVSKSPADTIDFTPTQKGTFKFACSMGMGYGTIIVE